MVTGRMLVSYTVATAGNPVANTMAYYPCIAVRSLHSSPLGDEDWGSEQKKERISANATLLSAAKYIA